MNQQSVIKDGTIMCLNFCKGNVVVKIYYKERKHHGVNTVDCHSITRNGCREISASCKKYYENYENNSIDSKLQIKLFPVINDLEASELNCACLV